MIQRGGRSSPRTLNCSTAQRFSPKAASSRIRRSSPDCSPIGSPAPFDESHPQVPDFFPGLSVVRGIIEHVFEGVSDVELVDFMGEETREESAAMGRRLAAVGELFARRKQQYVDAQFLHTDVYAAVAAEIS